MIREIVKEKTLCYHCGDPCTSKTISVYDKNFCCDGCKMVYEILNKVELCDYYDLNKNPGIKQINEVRKDKFAFLDDEFVRSKLIHFKSKTQSHAIFYLPQMHCSSCIWLLEHLHKVNKGIISSQVNFLKKEVSIVFDHGAISLREAVELLTSIGYEPHISLHDVSDTKIKKYNRSEIFKIGIAGFCFGNIMMFSFPEYFAVGIMEDVALKKLFSFLNVILALPVFFYCASGFFVSAFKSIRQKFLNIDAPIALAILITFSRSLYEIISGTGAGYFDSMSGIVFFMLIGRFFQNKTYNTLTFDRDYTSYFPLGVTVIEGEGKETQIPVSKLKKGDRIKIHSHEIIPADSILFLGKAKIDYSFVSGESLPIDVSIGEIVYAGGKQTSGAIQMEVVKEVSQSYLTQLWNNESLKTDQEEKKVSFVHAVSRYFTLILFTIAITSAVYWFIVDSSRVLNAVTAILIVACPCALLLSATFTNGNMLRILQRFGFYARNANVLERIAKANHIVFDKTGTITLQEESNLTYNGAKLSEKEQQLIRSLANQSNHPLSRTIVAALPFSLSLPAKKVEEQSSKGIRGEIDGSTILMGSSDYVLGKKENETDGSKVYVMINGNISGSFTIKTKYREGIKELLAGLKEKYKLSVISGDNNSEEYQLRNYFGKEADLNFSQKPQQKLDHIKSLQSKGDKVIMIGDGLNDAGALKESSVGIAITDNINNFSPACDVIFEGKQFSKLQLLLNYCSRSKQIIAASFILSILYNIIGLYFAVQGELTPVIAAILMPISSISIVLLTTGMSSLLSYKLKARTA